MIPNWAPSAWFIAALVLLLAVLASVCLVVIAWQWLSRNDPAELDLSEAEEFESFSSVMARFTDVAKRGAK